MLAVIGKGEAAARRNLRTRLVLERLTGKPQDDDYQSVDMANGIAREPLARDRYEQETGFLVRQVGFLQHLELMAGASPDGLIYQDGNLTGVLECKCRNAANHFEALTARIPSKAMPQLIHLLWLTGADFCDYVSYHPDFPERSQFVAARLMRDGLDLNGYEAKVRAFLTEVDEQLKQVESYAR